MMELILGLVIGICLGAACRFRVFVPRVGPVQEAMKPASLLLTAALTFFLPASP